VIGTPLTLLFSIFKKGVSQAPTFLQQNGMVERLIRSLKELCLHRQRFESLAHASRAIGGYIHFVTTADRTRRSA
jgi:hypothetical protein